MDNSDITYFSFFFSGHIDDNRDMESVKFDLLEFLPGEKNIIEKIAPSEELEIGQNLDFEEIVSLIKAFRKSGAGYKISLSSGSSKKKEPGTEIKIDRNLIEFELEIEKSKVIINEIEVEVSASEEMKMEIDNIKNDQQGKFGKKYIALNIKLNEVWEKRSEIVKKLLKRRKDDLLDHMRKLKNQTEKIRLKISDNEKDKLLLEEAYSVMKEGDNLLSRINSTADSAGFVPETGEQKSCFIATAVYGEDSSQVDFLRKWRDTVLKETVYGRAFIRIYYFISPSISVFIKRKQHLRNTTKFILDKVLNRLGSGLN